MLLIALCNNISTPPTHPYPYCVSPQQNFTTLASLIDNHLLQAFISAMQLFLSWVESINDV